MKAPTVEAINRERAQRTSKRRRPAAMTVADLVKDDGVPVSVRHWLEQFIEHGDGALEASYVAQEWATMDQARLIFDVLYSKYIEIGESTFSDEARDYVEEYLFRLALSADVQVWNYPQVAVAALPVLLDCARNADGDSPDLVALESAIRRLTTRAERRAFITAERVESATEDERNTEAAFKLARVLADPKTPAEVRDRLDDELLEFSSQSGVFINHPAPARRAFMLMCEARPRGKMRACARARRRLLALLDAIKSGEGQAGDAE
jgi:hypothetical protein